MAGSSTDGSYHGYDKTVVDQLTGPIFLSQYDPVNRTPSVKPGVVIKVNPAKKGSNVPRPFQKGRKKQFNQRKRGQFYYDCQAIKRDWRQNKKDHPRGYVFESHHKVVPVPAPTALDISQRGVRVLPGGVVDHFIHVNASHVPVPV